MWFFGVGIKFSQSFLISSNKDLSWIILKAKNGLEKYCTTIIVIFIDKNMLLKRAANVATWSGFFSFFGFFLEKSILSYDDLRIYWASTSLNQWSKCHEGTSLCPTPTSDPLFLDIIWPLKIFEKTSQFDSGKCLTSSNVDYWKWATSKA